MGVAALDFKAASITREAAMIAAGQEAADIIQEATDETGRVIKERASMQRAISSFERNRIRSEKLRNIPSTCPTVTCIDGLFINTWNDIAAGARK